jgi:hypothetical protein
VKISRPAAPRLARLAFALASAALSMLGGVPAGAAQPETTGIRLLDAPTTRADDPRARLYIVDHLAPGTTIHRRVEISNDTDASRTFQLYEAAASVKGGIFEFGEGRAANDLTTWTTVDPPVLTLVPRSTGTATVTIVVPHNASAGERYGVVWQEIGAPAPTAGGIGMVNRVGVRIYLSVGPGGEPPSDFRIGSVAGRRSSDGTAIVTASVQNTGGRALGVVGDLTLSDGPAGMSAGPFEVAIDTLAVGETRTSSLELDRSLPAGPWNATLTLRSDTLERTSEATLTFPAAGDSPDPSIALERATSLKDVGRTPTANSVVRNVAIAGGGVGVLGLLRLGRLTPRLRRRVRRPRR